MIPSGVALRALTLHPRRKNPEGCPGLALLGRFSLRACAIGAKTSLRILLFTVYLAGRIFTDEGKRGMMKARLLKCGAQIDIAAGITFNIHKNYLMALRIIATLLAGLFCGLIAKAYVDSIISRYPLKEPVEVDVPASGSGPAVTTDYKHAILERNLFRTKLNIEVPKPRSKEDIEEEETEAIVREMVLKGVLVGKDLESYAVIDRGPRKGVWAYGLGESIEKGLVVQEIKATEVLLKKGDLAFTLRLFAKGYEKKGGKTSPGPQKVVPPSEKKVAPAQIPADAIKREGKRVIISKDLAERAKVDRAFVNSLASTVAVKVNVDSRGNANGFQVVSVDKGSVAEKLGIQPGDVIQEVNGFRLTTQDEVNQAFEALKDARTFEVKILRRGKPAVLYYEIR